MVTKVEKLVKENFEDGNKLRSNLSPYKFQVINHIPKQCKWQYETLSPQGCIS